ncbi:MAG: sugar ABC transporter permease [Anaerolineaceae bacterium]|nr:sugar ABC transporter permease [Anaerolineaceae bacterium]MCY4023777.1 sugar ABC transporter permease [Anaerolineaceae bacterium]
MDRRIFLGFAAPSMVIMTLLMVVPLAMAIWLGMHFMTYDNVLEPQWVGLRNYGDALGDERFWQSVTFTAIYIAVVVPSWIVIGFVVALLLDQVTGLARGVYLSVFLLPFIIVPVVGTIMFRQLFEPSGLLRWVYQELFNERFRYTEQTVKSLVLIHGIWHVTPFTLVVYFAGLQTLPQDLMEASGIDGASRLQKIRHIVIPHVRSLTLFILLFSIMDSYRVFDSVYVLTELNPLYKANTIMTYTFQTATQLERLGKANAMAVLTVIGIMVVLIPNLYLSWKEQIAER